MLCLLAIVNFTHNVDRSKPSKRGVASPHDNGASLDSRKEFRTRNDHDDKEAEEYYLASPAKKQTMDYGEERSEDARDKSKDARNASKDARNTSKDARDKNKDRRDKSKEGSLNVLSTASLQHASAQRDRQANKDADEFEDISESDPEDLEDYKPGGYHPVNPGDRFKDGRYVIIRKLGWGHFSTVWLSTDLQTQQQVALKIVKSARHYTEAAEDEIKLLEKVRQCALTANSGNHIENEPNMDHVVALLDHFRHVGPHGNHVCMVFEVLGDNLLRLIRRTDHQGLPLELVRRIAKQLLQGLDLLHRHCKIIHTDLKPENVLLCLTDEEIINLSTATNTDAEHGSLANVVDSQSTARPNPSDTTGQLLSTPTGKWVADLSIGMEGVNLESARQRSLQSSTSAISLIGRRTPIPNNLVSTLKVKIADLGNACWVHRHFTDDIQTRQYRSPEVLLGHQYDTSTDIWSLACLLFELATGDYLFAPHSGKRYSKDEDHLAQMIELLGPIPTKWALGGKYSLEFFTRKGHLRHIADLDFWNLESVLLEKYRLCPKDAAEFSKFLLPMLEILPKKRATAADCLASQWLRGVNQ